MEFHVPQDRIRIFIPGFDSNPCQGLVHVADMSSDEKTILFVKGFSCRILCKKSSSIYIPRTQMTLVLIGKGLVLRG